MKRNIISNLLITCFAICQACCLKTIQTEVIVQEIYDDSVSYYSKYLYIDEKLFATHNGKKYVKQKLSKSDRRWNALFEEEIKELKELGLNIKYPNLNYEDICRVSTFIRCIDDLEKKSKIGQEDQQIISKSNINEYYTYLFQETDYIFSFEIIVDNNILKGYTYKCRPNFSDKIVTFDNTFKYDNKGRIIQTTMIYSDEEENIKGKIVKNIVYNDIINVH